LYKTCRRRGCDQSLSEADIPVRPRQRLAAWGEKRL
jgi:hypothetical protein